MKVCSKCGELKSKELFYKGTRYKDGLRAMCKECMAKGHKDYYQANKEVIIDYGKQYRQENKESVALWHELYYQKHKEYRAINSKIYYRENKDVINKRHARWCLTHKDELKEYYRKNFLKNKDRYCIKAARYRARKRNLPHTLTSDQWEMVKLHFEHKCAYCGEKRPLAQEHVVPVTLGGEYSHNNIVPSCISCNSSKRDRLFFVWYPKFKHYSKSRETKILKYLNYSNGIQQLSLL